MGIDAMSLINKMLQDLDARGTPAGEAYPTQIKPVPRAARPLPLRAIAAAAGIVVAGGVGWFAWQHLHAPAPQPVTAPVAATVQPAAAPQGNSFEAMEPDGSAARAARRTMASMLAARQAAPVPAPEPAAVVVPAAPPAPAKPARAAATERKAVPAKVDAKVVKAAPPAAAHAKPVAAVARQDGVGQRAESAYRRALDRLQDGRTTESMAALEEALRIDPAHEAARQTLVGLLVEAGRVDDAMRQLQLGLTQDPRQPALAMLLARLQIERGASGIETLTRTLPYAGNNPDYHAFLGGALERQQRHREAAEQYLLAVRAAPANGVWWMGLGMALQADKRNGEALEAFQKARASGVLNGELAAFVERRIQQLSR
jgi:MSHA biogenesis protein MshN